MSAALFLLPPPLFPPKLLTSTTPTPSPHLIPSLSFPLSDLTRPKPFHHVRPDFRVFADDADADGGGGDDYDMDDYEVEEVDNKKDYDVEYDPLAGGCGGDEIAMVDSKSFVSTQGWGSEMIVDYRINEEEFHKIKLLDCDFFIRKPPDPDNDVYDFREMYVTPPDTDIYGIPRVLAPMPEKYIRCAKSDYGCYNVTEPPIDAPRDPMYKSDWVVRKTMKSYIWLQTTDGSIQEVEQEVAILCPLLCKEIHTGMGSSKTYPISLPSRVNPAMLGLILDYCRFHLEPGHSNKERKSYDEKFIRMDSNRLCELVSAADSLQMKPLVDLTSRAIARMIEGKTPEEIRETFHLPDDLTEEEKLEPLRNITDDPRIRLLNRLYARKRRELKERQKLKNVEVEAEPVDDRSVDDLLSFINGGDGDSKGVRTSKTKKKNRRRKEQQKNTPSVCNTTSNSSSSSNNVIEIHKKESNGFDSACNGAKVNGHFLPNICELLKLQDTEDDRFIPEDEFDDDDTGDEIDPVIKEQIDREVEDFARRLNSDWPERVQELLSLGQEKRPNPIPINANRCSKK